MEDHKPISNRLAAFIWVKTYFVGVSAVDYVYDANIKCSIQSSK